MLLRTDLIPSSIFTRLESRDIALWIRSIPVGNDDQFLRLLSLPWSFIVLEQANANFLITLDKVAAAEADLTRRRGFIQVIDSDPSRIELPPRCLPLYLINGRSAENQPGFVSQLRRINILESIRRSEPRQILVLGEHPGGVPAELKELWATGFRSELTIAAYEPHTADNVEDWANSIPDGVAATLLGIPDVAIAENIALQFSQIYPPEQVVVRVRDNRGGSSRIDLSPIDDPERPILEFYQLIQERELVPLSPQDLSHDEFVAFFRDPSASWRPYAAGLPWVRDKDCSNAVFQILRKLDSVGPEENRVAYLAAEPGSGGTTITRTIAWQCARAGYPTLVAKQTPFTPDSLRLVNFLSLAHIKIEEASLDSSSTVRRYEAPWIVVFDVLHWQYRESELERFKNDIQKSGRPICIIVVSGPSVPLAYHVSSSFREVGTLSHVIEESDARSLGDHLNRFLREYGRERPLRQWENFYKDHAVRLIDGAVAFWITLSFWIQGQYDLSESIQEWMYRAFSTSTASEVVKVAILHIAALSTERIPIPESLLPRSNTRWPISQLLSDAQSELAGLGLIRISSDGIFYWGMVHDILGRFLINGLFYDFNAREQFGFAHANTPEDLRFMLLRRISQEPRLGEVAYRSTGEEFATTIFKIDQGRLTFAAQWRDVLAALDEMPRSLRDTSRVFRHHVAISRRRIAMLDDRIYGVSNRDRQKLLEDAISDILYALNDVAFTQGSESDLNLLNSLARAYQDLESVESTLGASKARLAELRLLANQATRRAYDENPNSFTIETYVKNLLLTVRESSGPAVAECIEALGILHSALTSNETAYRAAELQKLSDQALNLLFTQSPIARSLDTMRTPIDVLVEAWRTLAVDRVDANWSFADTSNEARHSALEILSNPIARGSIQAIRLSYDLTCLSSPKAFRAQLSFAEQLQISTYKASPQLTLEYAILLYQAERAFEGDAVFKSLRSLWRESEYFVQVPDRLRWLWSKDGNSLQTVSAITGSDYGNRTLARVDEFRLALVPFRPEEHGMSTTRAGTRFRCHVSFGHNGPFLRPVTAGPHPDGDNRG